jgi:hypothetical protein
MKRTSLFIIPVLLLFSCQKGNNLPSVETISKGSKWGIQVGSPHADVYAQLQKLGKEKGFNEVEIINQQSFSSPEKIQHSLDLYQTISLQNNNGALERIVIQFNKDKVSMIITGGTNTNNFSKWPQDVPDEISIHENDDVSKVYDKLLAIYQTTKYNNYEIRLSNKSLEKPFDLDMANYDEWNFYIFEDINPGKSGRSYVRLFFKNGKLNKIQHEYNEFEVYD